MKRKKRQYWSSASFVLIECLLQLCSAKLLEGSFKHNIICYNRAESYAVSLENIAINA